MEFVQCCWVLLGRFSTTPSLASFQRRELPFFWEIKQGGLWSYSTIFGTRPTTCHHMQPNPSLRQHYSWRGFAVRGLQIVGGWNIRWKNQSFTSDLSLEEAISNWGSHSAISSYFFYELLLPSNSGILVFSYFVQVLLPILLRIVVLVFSGV